MQPGPKPKTFAKKKLIIPVVIIALVIGAIIFFPHDKQLATGGKGDDSGQKVLAEAINGGKVEPEIAEQRPMAIMVENHPDSRPQAGLSRADIVYETLAEGGITRYLALFQTQAVENLGPVRSVRIYYAVLADQWRSILVHVGGNSIALQRLANNSYKNVTDIDEYFNGSYFRRVSSRPAPHNVYTSIEKIRELVKKKEASLQAKNPIWKFKDDAPANPPTATNIVIPFSTPQFTAGFRYDPSANIYLRSLAGKADKDANNQQQLRAKSVIVQFAVESVLPTDAIGTIDLKLSGSGKALVFQDGNVTNATWRQENNFTRYYNEIGEEIALNRGLVWVAIVPTTLTSAVTYSAQ